MKITRLNAEQISGLLEMSFNRLSESREDEDKEEIRFWEGIIKRLENPS